MLATLTVCHCVSFCICHYVHMSWHQLRLFWHACNSHIFCFHNEVETLCFNSSHSAAH